MLKQVQAGRLLGRSLKQVADLHLKLKHGSKAQGAETALREAVQVLEVGGGWRWLEAVQVLEVGGGWSWLEAVEVLEVGGGWRGLEAVEVGVCGNSE